MKSILKKLIISSLVVVFSFIFICVHFKDFGRHFLSASFSNYYHGDLYGFSKLDNFKENISLTPIKPETNSLGDAKLITMGDSFFTANYDSPIFPDLLEEKSKESLYNLNRQVFQTYNDNPLQYFEETNYIKGKEKILILESVERYVIERSVRYTEDFTNVKEKIVPNDTNIPINKEDPLNIKLAKFLNPVREFLPQSNLEYFAYNSVFTEPFYKLGKTFRFSLYDELDSRIGTYSNNPKNLYYYEETNFAKKQKDDALINEVANNINYLKNQLKEKYNIDLIFLIIPNKYSLYCENAMYPMQYDNFIPRLTKALNEKGVKAPDIYSLYKEELKKNPSAKLYYSSDTHYAPLAKDIAVNATLRELIKN
ncbi:alginate O-acetyltransferase AlgX-related protein [Clostridium fallax]|uniref:SGNH hydrolase-like domain-containing protein, acetyltransferase AlgX n=1 Tax=Clostridium fallax TaxID=1533 RepID=A0A1M4SZL6_9CLOT|nr:hypothetical protein [Clostridium fallax]SHE37467.1 SGNH hydrolase-like domain-containing protein, acetyltransferase AlgX [Clostridium fallax]SQB08043.1 Uncharacterised protein [Clostridium fallax]